MSKLSEPVAKALQALLDKCKGDTMVFMRTITGNYSEENYFFNLIDEIKLIRCANFDDILIALVEGLPKAIKTTEQPSAAAAVEGILTEEELKERNRLLVLENDDLLAENTKLKNSLKAIATASTNLADSLKIQANLTLEELK